MLKNYLFVALRNIRRNKLVSFINVMGFVLGIVCCLLITQYVVFETSYDTFHQDAEDIYRITWFSENPHPRTPHPMAQALIQDFPEVISAVSFTPIWGPGLTKQTFSVWNPENDHRFEEKEVLAADSTFFDVFSFPFISGDPKTVLTHPNGIVITEATARKYFGNEDPMGKTLVINEERNLFEVVGVLENIPDNAHFHFDILIPYILFKSEEPNDPFFSWDDFGHYNYIRLTKDTDVKGLETKLLDWAAQYIDINEEVMQNIRSSGAGFRLQPLTDIHLTSHIRWELEPNGNIYYVYLMSAAALFILIIACVNFMNLSTARSMDRAKEIGVRKALGALKKQLAGQFLMEALVYSLLALPITLVLLNFVLPVFNHIAGMSLEMEDFTHLYTIVGLLTGVAVIGLLSGLYPAFYLSSFKPVAILKGNFKTGKQGALARKGLVIFQFSISIILIIGSIVIFDQLKFLSDKNLGFDQEQIVVLPLRNDEVRAQVETIKNELMRIEGVKSVAASSNVPGSGFNMNEIWWDEQPRHRVASSECAVDYDYFATLNIPMVEGRGFSRDFTTDSMNAFVINQTAVRALNLENPVGKEIVWDADITGGAMKGTVVGVVQDFHFQSLHEPIRPLLFVMLPEAYNHLILKIKPQQMQNTLAAIETAWQQFDKQYAFAFSFLDENMNQLYQSENQMGKVFGIFSIITVLIACSGLFGLATFTVAQRTKEVGVRKVLGASMSSILQLLSKDFLKLVGVAIVAGSPIAWYIMDRWLENFSYRVDITWWMFALAACLILVVALITVSYQAMKAAMDNPVKSLRSE